MPENLLPPPDQQPTDPWALERLLAGGLQDSSSELAQLLDALVAPASQDELAGETAAVTAFGELGSGVSSAPTSTSGRSRMLTSLVASKLAIATATAGVALAGTVAAAYAGALPTGLQNAAHHTIGAPAASIAKADATDEASSPADEPSATEDPTSTQDPTSTGSPTSTSVGPDATGPAAFGLCTAYTHGGLATTSIAYQSLVKAAGGSASGIAAYCATVAHPGSATSHPTGSPTAHPTGSPTRPAVSHPTGSPTTHPGGFRTSHPTGSPTTHPGR